MKKIKLLFLFTALVTVIGSRWGYAQGTVQGRVLFEGTAPAAEKVDVKSDMPTCGTVKEVSKIVLGQDQGVANAVVKIVGAPGTAAPGTGKLDQIKCEFVPHVQALLMGSTLKITSSDPVLHNSHAFFEDGTTAFNIAVPIMGMEISKKLDKAGLLKFRCDAGHTWMSAYVAVLSEPFFAVTDADGNFTIEGVPAGNYELEVWHEWLGTHREPLVVKEGEPASATLTLKQP